MSTRRQPNILLIQCDQLRYDGLGCNGNTFAVTPNLDQFASESIQHQRHITACPVCMPSRASLFTGRYPSGHGLWHNGVALPREEYVHFDPVASGVEERSMEGQIISHVPTLPDVLSEAGYHTRAIGKLHLTPTGSDSSYGYEESRGPWERGAMDDWHGPYYGFDHVDLSIGHGESTIGHYRAWLEVHHPEVVQALKDGKHRRELEFPELPSLYPSAIPVEAHHSTWVANSACEFLRGRAKNDEPFFLYLGFPDPHHPFTPPAELATEFATHDTLPPATRTGDLESKPSIFANLVDGPNRRLSGRGLSAECIKRMRQYTDAMIHLIDRSVGDVLDTLHAAGLDDDTVVIFTSDHGDFLGDHDLIMKDTLGSNALVHVPFLMRVPGGPSPTESLSATSNVDVMPTLLELAGAKIPAQVQGESMVAAHGSSADRVVLVYGYQHDARNHNFSIYDARYRFTYYPQTKERELYDHLADPHELTNLAGVPIHEDVENKLLASLLEHHMRFDNPAGGRIARF